MFLRKFETGDAKSIKKQPRRLPNYLRTVVEYQIEVMLANHIVKPSYSPRSSLIVLVRKKDGTWCFCIDISTRLIDVTAKNAISLLQIVNLMDNLLVISSFPHST